MLSDREWMDQFQAPNSSSQQTQNLGVARAEMKSTTARFKTGPLTAE
jgi:hypothetical protein